MTGKSQLTENKFRHFPGLGIGIGAGLGIRFGLEVQAATFGTHS